MSLGIKSSAFLRVSIHYASILKFRIYREAIVNLSWIYREPNYRASIENLSRIYREPIVNLSWIYRKPIPDASHLKCVWRIRCMQIMEFNLKWVHMAQYELILRLDGAPWLRIISKPPDPKRGYKNTKKSVACVGVRSKPAKPPSCLSSLAGLLIHALALACKTERRGLKEKEPSSKVCPLAHQGRHERKNSIFLHGYGPWNNNLKWSQPKFKRLFLPIKTMQTASTEHNFIPHTVEFLCFVWWYCWITDYQISRRRRQFRRINSQITTWHFPNATVCQICCEQPVAAAEHAFWKSGCFKALAQTDGTHPAAQPTRSDLNLQELLHLKRVADTRRRFHRSLLPTHCWQRVRTSYTNIYVHIWILQEPSCCPDFCHTLNYILMFLIYISLCWMQWGL